jgi:hypothetical protein
LDRGDHHTQTAVGAEEQSVWFCEELNRYSVSSRFVIPVIYIFYIYFLTFIQPGRPVENKFSFTTATWPRKSKAE